MKPWPDPRFDRPIGKVWSALAIALVTLGAGATLYGLAAAIASWLG